MADAGALITQDVAPDGSPCAVKRLRPGDIHRDDLRLRLDNEGRVLAFLAGTPGVIRLLGVREHPLALLLEWSDGGSLDERLRAGNLTGAQRRRVALELVAVVRACHARGVTHRDIKPSNVLFVAGAVRLADFGVAAWGVARRAVPDGWEEDEVGTPPWAAPELRRAATTQTAPAVDVYGIARTLAALLDIAPVDRVPLVGRATGPTLSAWITAALSEAPERRPPLSELQRLI
ncbi:MAG: protein kinase domain-containing protein [Gemmatimonadales bacterium]